MDNAAQTTRLGAEHAPSRRIVYLTPDCTDSAVRKRAHGFVGLGHGLVSFSFRRARYDIGYEPDWPNVELGETTERRLAARLLSCLGALRIIHRNRRTWQEATMLYVRNLDLAFLALVAKFLTRSRAPLVYEVLDVHPGLTKKGPRAALLRWLERAVLKRCELLVVSSPAFLNHYYRPVQGYKADTFLLENKWPHERFCLQPRKIPCDLADNHPIWTIGWFGNIRCHESLDVLTELADELPDRVRIYIRGCASLLGEEKLMNTIRDRDNMIYEGAYRAPDDFPAIYSKVHFNWCGDLGDGDNSLWLLPNRLYEGGYFGIPALAIASHETGRIVRDRQLGLSLDVPLVASLKRALLEMTSDEYLRLRQRIEATPVSHFVDTGDMAHLMRVAPGSHGGNSPAHLQALA